MNIRNRPREAIKLKSWLDRKSLKFKLWLYLILFAAVIMLILWFLQIVFLNTYYKRMKASEIKKIGNELVSQFGEDDFEDIIYSTSFKGGIMIQVLNRFGMPVVPSNPMREAMPPREESMFFLDFIKQVSQSKEGKILYTVENPRLRSPTIVYGAVLNGEGNEPLYLYISGLLDPIDSTIEVLKNQLIIVTIISFLLAIGLSVVIALKVSKPITKVTDAASVLAESNYDVVFEYGDYTEINKLVDTLNYATKELSKTEELRREFMASVSHDLKTPLTLIKSYAEMIHDISGNNVEKRNAHLKVIIDESDRLTELVDDILNLSKLQAGIANMEYNIFDIGETTDNILERFKVFAERDGYVFKLHSDDNTKVIGDEKKIEQVIYNLISNAVNFTGEDKSVTINIKNLGEYIQFEVEDTGQGISEEEKGHIWDRYYRSGKTHKRTVVGTGVGLSIVKNILAAHDANFGIDSEVGKGSRFWFQLKRG